MLRGDRVAHAYVLAAPEGAGKATLASAVAAALLCPHSIGSGGTACGKCATCLAVARRSHPSVTWMEATGPLRIEEARRLGREAALAPHTGPCSIFVLEGAERLTGPAAVALLKTLEDPPGPLVALLLAEHPDQIEATLRSRCLVVRLPPVPVDELATWLTTQRTDAPAARIAAAARAARGLPGRALHLVDGGEPQGAGDGQIVSALTGDAPSQCAAALAAAGVQPGRVLELLRDACVRRQALDGEVASCSGAAPELLQGLEDMASPAAVAAAAIPCLRAVEASASNVNPALNWHVLVHRLRRGPTPC
jgi:hypothetical protein